MTEAHVGSRIRDRKRGKVVAEKADVSSPAVVPVTPKDTVRRYTRDANGRLSILVQEICSQAKHTGSMSGVQARDQSMLRASSPSPVVSLFLSLSPHALSRARDGTGCLSQTCSRVVARKQARVIASNQNGIV